MNSVELIRSRIVRGMEAETIRLRVYVSSVSGNAEEVDLLKGEDQAQLIARLTEAVLEHLGIKSNTNGSAQSKVQRAVYKAVGRSAGLL